MSEPHRTPRAVFLDLDGCLVDSRAAISRCLNVGLEAVGAAPRREEELYPLIGPPLYESFLGLLRREGRPAVDDAADVAARCVDAYRRAYADVSLAETTAVVGMSGVLERLASEASLAVVTSKPAEFAVPILEAVGLAGYFDAVHAPGLEVRAEPKAVTLARALEDVAPGVPAGATVMVGDRYHDVDAGRARGTRTIGVTWGIGSAAELEHADAIVDVPEALPAAIRG